MFDFRDIVTSILLEEDPAPTGSSTTPQQTNNIATPSQKLPDWFNNILKKHNEAFGTNITATDLQTLWAVVAGKNYLADRDAAANIDKIRLLDLLYILRASVKNLGEVKDWNRFVSYLNSTYPKADGEALYKEVANITPATKSQWPIKDASVNRAYQKALADGDKMASVALETYDQNNVVGAVQEMIKKRIGVFTRIAKLKDPITPFGDLVLDIFKQPEPYLSGQKKYTSDFEAVDDLYIKDIIKIALAAKEFYASEIAKLKMQQLETSSLNSFNRFVGNLLEVRQLSQTPRNIRRRENYAAKKSQQQTQNEPTQEFNKELFDKLYDEALKDYANRLKFLQGTSVTYNIVDNDNKVVGQGQTDPKKYIIGNIKKMESTEAQNLINALRAIAQYTKKGLGAGEAAGRLAGAASALRVGMGPVG